MNLSYAFADYRSSRPGSGKVVPVAGFRYFFSPRSRIRLASKLTIFQAPVASRT